MSVHLALMDVATFALILLDPICVHVEMGMHLLPIGVHAKVRLLQNISFSCMKFCPHTKHNNIYAILCMRKFDSCIVVSLFMCAPAPLYDVELHHP